MEENEMDRIWAKKKAEEENVSDLLRSNDSLNKEVEALLKSSNKGYIVKAAAETKSEEIGSLDYIAPPMITLESEISRTGSAVDISKLPTEKSPAIPEIGLPPEESADGPHIMIDGPQIMVDGEIPDISIGIDGQPTANAESSEKAGEKGPEIPEIEGLPLPTEALPPNPDAPPEEQAIPKPSSATLLIPTTSNVPMFEPSPPAVAEVAPFRFLQPTFNTSLEVLAESQTEDSTFLRKDLVFFVLNALSNLYSTTLIEAQTIRSYALSTLSSYYRFQRF